MRVCVAHMDDEVEWIYSRLKVSEWWIDTLFLSDTWETLDKSTRWINTLSQALLDFHLFCFIFFVLHKQHANIFLSPTHTDAHSSPSHYLPHLASYSHHTIAHISQHTHTPTAHAHFVFVPLRLGLSLIISDTYTRACMHSSTMNAVLCGGSPPLQWETNRA